MGDRKARGISPMIRRQLRSIEGLLYSRSFYTSGVTVINGTGMFDTREDGA
jgi:hypothetical protein